MLTAGFRRIIFHGTEVVNCPMTDVGCPMFRPNSGQLTKGTKIGIKDIRIIKPAHRNRISTMPERAAKFLPSLRGAPKGDAAVSLIEIQCHFKRLLRVPFTLSRNRRVIKNPRPPSADRQ